MHQARKSTAAVMTATDVLISAMEKLEPEDIDGVVVVLVSRPQSDGVSITSLSNMQDKQDQVDALLDAVGVILHSDSDLKGGWRAEPE